MRGVHIVGTWCFILNIYLVSPHEDPAPIKEGSFIDALLHSTKSTVPNEEENSAPSDDPYTYVAMLDIQFIDQTKKICSAAIIHDHVAITAAHCLIKQGSNPELTLSFVTIGTEKMYATGYEHFVPIERYKHHPRFRGWTAAIVLVYTYAAMSVHNPGKIISLAGDKLKNPIDTSVTVLSWGSLATPKKKKQQKKVPIQAAPEEDTDKTVSEDGPTGPVVIDVKRYGLNTARKSEMQTLPSQQPKVRPRGKGNILSITSLPQSIESEIDGVTLHFRVNKETANTTTGRIQEEFIKARSRDFRRSFVHEKRKLTTQVFGFMDLHKCRELVEAVKTAIFANTLSDYDDFVCISSEKHLITDEDLGAPLVRQGRLFGVAVGGVRSPDGQHVAIAMRMPCFCSWIAENLPWGGDKWECCKECCFPLVTSPRPIPKNVVAFEARKI